MDSKGGSLPAMPEPKNPTSMKQLSDSPCGCKGRGDGITDPALMDKAATQLAATPHDGVLQKIGNHNHTHEHLKDLTSRFFNGDQETMSKFCTSPPGSPLLKAVESGPPDSSPELTLKITKHLPNGKSPPPSRYEASYGEDGTEETNATLILSDGMLAPANAINEGIKLRGPVKKVPPSRRHPLEPAVNGSERSTFTHIVEPCEKSRESYDLAPESDVLISESNDATVIDVPTYITSNGMPVLDTDEATVVQGVGDAETLLTDQQPHVQFSVGDIVWAKVCGYPWWPCMITTDPEFNLHFRENANNCRGLFYHIQYFSDTPERGYVPGKNLVIFSEKEQYQTLCRGNKQTTVPPDGKKLLIPRKVRIPWDTGISQATEAVSLPVEERLAKFSFTYEGNQPRFNSCILQELQCKQQQQQSHEEFPDTASLTPPDSTQSSPITVQTPSNHLTPPLPTNSSTSARKMSLATKAPKVPASRGQCSHKEKNALCKRRKKAAPVVVPPHIDTGVQEMDIAADKVEPVETTMNKSGIFTKDSSLNQDVLFAEIDPQFQASQKKLRKLKQKFPAAPSSLKRKKIKASAITAERLNTELLKPVILDAEVCKMKKKLKKNKTEAVFKVMKKASKRALEEPDVEDVPQPRKKAKLGGSLKRHETLKAQAPEPSVSMRKRKRQKSAINEKRKRSKAPISVVEPQNKGRWIRNKNQDPSNQSLSVSSKKHGPSIQNSYQERPDSPTDEALATRKAERAVSNKKESVCQVCEKTSEDLVTCEGQCYGSYHLQCLGLDQSSDKVLCTACRTGVHACFTCKKSEGELKRCSVLHCGRFYHETCLRLSALTVFDNRGFRCPLHTCLSCHCSGRGTAKATKGKMIRCLRCPVAYHSGDLCVAAGSETLTPTTMLCTNHFNPKKGYRHHTHVNVSWCFICSKGGSLLCCESCPAAFHPDCLNITMPDGSWFCYDCRSGKKPKYRDIIWVKLGNYRWWPAEIRHPRNIPTNIQHLRHEIGEFPVYFFGSKDYYWTHQGRVFPYMEGDRASRNQKTGIGKVFKNAVLEAEARFNQIKMEREAKEAQENNRKPPPYKYIKVNKPVGHVQIYTADIAEIPKCNCKPSDERPCSFESECLNRMLLYECHPQVCPAGARCMNQDFTKRLYPETKIIRTAGKGWGLISLRDIKKGEFVNEYVGELIDEEECRARIKYAQENDITHFYMLTIDKDRIIDAGPKGNYSRFMNHSCQPNCETQKWTVNGDTRVGLFAVCDIPAGTELTFNYNLDCLGNEKTVCRCDAPNCSGFLGDRPKITPTSEPKAKLQKKKPRRRRARSEGKKQSEDECFRCGDGGQLVLCDRKGCTKAYHLSCLDRTKRPFGRWDCPWHHCDVCGKPSEAFCQRCPNSFCKAHEEGMLRAQPTSNQLCCQEHDESDLHSTPAVTQKSDLTTKHAKRGRKPGAQSSTDTAAKKRSRKHRNKQQKGRAESAAPLSPPPSIPYP
ncbi:histone-lysine N-methyltransferase NSD2 [Tachysurus fulvidraco]|uniref:histone-lysine N-methyltransferase NSD2 n=1 Tax=Tachysurus fulvidraco TaxID=1234273 RepID=UPI001FF024D3|nr:histone-lysine N-methyltransferase NSD2 [Tachysurus fulvidraco]XP_027006140.2 histone-lysine N-methyltransferase NSD2 [Tachysurus fulvidraco]XP_027006142.2 histone-lysine N-methyltransferase NSD2 [Tachysurus fulvidraco]